MKVLITGATGFIGSHLVTALLKKNYKVAITKRQESRKNTFDSMLSRIEIIDSDTYHDINSGMKYFNPDIVVHLATLYINKHDPENISSLMSSNITFGAYILEAMKENNINYFLNIGTRWQHINNNRYNPANLYAATKEAFKNIMIYYEKTGIKHKTLELSDTFGTGDTRQKIIDILISACTKNEMVELTPGKQVLDLLHVEDVCNFITSNIRNDAFFDNETISLSGTVIKLRDLGAMIEKESGKKGVLGWGLKQYRENEVMKPPLYYRKVQLNNFSIEEYIKIKLRS